MKSNRIFAIGSLCLAEMFVQRVRLVVTSAPCRIFARNIKKANENMVSERPMHMDVFLNQGKDQGKNIFCENDKFLCFL